MKQKTVDRKMDVFKRKNKGTNNKLDSSYKYVPHKKRLCTQK